MISYVFVRFMPNTVTEEFVNVGIVAFDHTDNRFHYKLLDYSKRVNKFFRDLPETFYEGWSLGRKLEYEDLTTKVHSVEDFKNVIINIESTVQYSRPVVMSTECPIEAIVDDLFKEYC